MVAIRWYKQDTGFPNKLRRLRNRSNRRFVRTKLSSLNNYKNLKDIVQPELPLNHKHSAFYNWL